MSVASSSWSAIERGENYCKPRPATSTYRSSSASSKNRRSRKVRREDREAATALRDCWGADQLRSQALSRLTPAARATWVAMAPVSKWNMWLGEFLSEKSYTDEQHYDGIVPVADCREMLEEWDSDTSPTRCSDKLRAYICG